jgi:protein SCO1/2
MTRFARGGQIIAAILCTATVLPWTAAQTSPDMLPEELADVGIDEHLSAQLPLDLEFTDQDARKVRLRDYFDGRRPVILALNYYKCPMLCGLMLNGLLDGLKGMDQTAGDDFQIVTVSFDPLETTPLARQKRDSYLAAYGRPEAARGWHFLTGRQASIKPLLETTGYRIAWNEHAQQWMHAAAVLICTPDGRISRYLYGILFEPRTLRLSLVEASQGKIGTTVDRVLLYCYHYDGEGYSLTAMNLVRAGGVLTILCIATLLLGLWRFEVRRRKVAPPTA